MWLKLGHTALLMSLSTDQTRNKDKILKAVGILIQVLQYTKHTACDPFRRERDLFHAGAAFLMLSVRCMYAVQHALISANVGLLRLPKFA